MLQERLWRPLDDLPLPLAPALQTFCQNITPYLYAYKKSVTKPTSNERIGPHEGRTASERRARHVAWLKLARSTGASNLAELSWNTAKTAVVVLKTGPTYSGDHTKAVREMVIRSEKDIAVHQNNITLEWHLRCVDGLLLVCKKCYASRTVIKMEHKITSALKPLLPALDTVTPPLYAQAVVFWLLRRLSPHVPVLVARAVETSWFQWRAVKS